jgi:hypothetical protein
MAYHYAINARYAMRHLYIPSPVERDTFAPDAHKTRNLIWAIGWRSNKPFADTARFLGGGRQAAIIESVDETKFQAH